MHAWHGRATSLTRVNPIYSEGEDAIAGRSKASSSGYGSQRGSGGGSYNGRAPPSTTPPNNEDIYHTYSGRTFGQRSQIYQTASEIYASRYKPPKRQHGFLNAILRGKDDDFKANSGRDANFFRRNDNYLKSWNAKTDYQIKIISKEYDYLKKLDGSSSSETYDDVINNDNLPIVNFLPRVKSKEAIKEEDKEELEKESFFDSLQADPFLLYSRFIEEEENKEELEKEAENSSNSENTYTTIADVHKTINGDSVSRIDKVISVNDIDNREAYLRNLLRDVSVALDNAAKARRPESQSGMLEEARECLAMGLIALRRSEPGDLEQLSVALAKEPAKATMPMAHVNKVLNPPPSPHAKRPSLWQHYYMRTQSMTSLDSMSACLSHVRPEAQFTMNVAAERRLAARLAKSRKTKRICRIVSIFMALFFFMLSIVLCSMLLTNGRATFGSMM